MSRSGWLVLVLAGASGGAAAAVPRPPAEAVARTAIEFVATDDPFPIRRLRSANPSDLLKELEPGPVVRLPRADFEARVRAAGRAVAQAKLAARVVDAAYTATLDGGDLTGTAEIGILNAHDVTGFVPLDPLRLAVRSAAWADGEPAVLAVPTGGAAPAVWVDRVGRRVLRLNWSLAGTTEPGERRFEFRTPPCPAAVLELDVPDDQVPTAPADVLLTGPFEVPGAPGRRAWRLRFGGRSKVEFAVRAGGATGTPAVAKLVARYDLAPGQLGAAFEYELHPVRGSADEWAFTADPGLRVTDVATNNRAGWVVDPPAVPNGPRRIRVRLRQPGPGGKVVVTAVAPFPDPAHPDAPLPIVRPVNAVLEDEKLELRLAPGLKVDAWAPGDYRLTDAASPPPGAADSPRVLTLAGGLLAPGAGDAFRRPPTVHASPGDAEFTTLERLEWEPDPIRSALVARLGVRVRRGPLFQLVVRPPPGFSLDRGASAADELVAHVGPATAAGYVVELARPLATGQRAELRLEFRGPGARPGEPVPFPAFAVPGAAERDGWLSVVTGPDWSATVRPGAGAAHAGPWNWLTADAPSAGSIYLYRGREPDGTVVLAAARPSVTADARVTVDAPGADWVATTRFTLTATDGPVPALAAFVPGAAGDRSWKLLDDANGIVDAVPVPQEFLDWAPLAAPFDVRAAVVGALARFPSDGTVWVLRFARPLTGTAALETTATGPRVGDTGAAVPVPRVLGAHQTIRVEAAPGVRDRTNLAVAGDSVSVRRTARADAPDRPPVSDAYLVTAVRGPGDVLAAFGGTVRDGVGGKVRLFLPPGAAVRGVFAAGRWLNPAACSDRDPDGALTVPLPAGAAVPFEVRYRLPVAAEWPTEPIVSPVPGVAGETPRVKRWWTFAAGVLPAGPARPGDAAVEEPVLWGGPLASGELRTVVARADDERVRVGAARTADAGAAVLAAAVVVLGVAAVRRRGRAGALLGGAVGGAVVVALLTSELGPPWWARLAGPPLWAATGTLGVVLGAVAVRRRGAVPVAVAAALLAISAPAVVAVAQPGAPSTVLIAVDAAGHEEIVAARATLERLDALAKPAPPAAVVAAAEYSLRTDAAGAHVVAKFTVRAFGGGDNAVALPLTDARLERATVDGAAAFPTAPRADGYVLAVGGPGRHEIELQFAATVAANGPEREVRFGVPEVPAAKLTAVLPVGARLPAVVGRVGRQGVLPGDGTALECDLGGVRVVHLRWREGAGGAAAVKIREGCVWDVTETGADLTAAYLVRVEQGTVVGMRFEIPAELEVVRVAARATDPAGPIPLRDWSLAPEKSGFRLLRLDFQAPTAGRFVAVLECAPRKPIGRQPVLRFPRVSFGAITGETEAVYGLRVARVTVDGAGPAGLVDYPPDAFKDFAAVPDLKLDPNVQVRAFRPVPQGAAELHPNLRVGEPPLARTVTGWQVGPHRADASGTITWTAKDPLPLVEFSAAGAKVIEVRGPEVAAWNQTGGRVQVWLRAPAREGTIEWTGTGAPVPPGKPADPITFDATRPRVHGSQIASDEVRVRAIPDWAVRPERAPGWRATPDPAGALDFQTEAQNAPAIRVHLIPLAAGK